MEKTGFSENNFNRLVSRTLRAGVALCLLLLAAGAALGAAGAGFSAQVLRLGVLAIVLTPVLRVAALVYGFYRAGQYLFSLAALLVLGTLMSAMLI